MIGNEIKMNKYTDAHMEKRIKWLSTPLNTFETTDESLHEYMIGKEQKNEHHRLTSWVYDKRQTNKQTHK